MCGYKTQSRSRIKCFTLLDSEKSKYELLCKDNTRAPIDSYKSCSLGRVPAHAVISRKDPQLAELIWNSINGVQVKHLMFAQYKERLLTHKADEGEGFQVMLPNNVFSELQPLLLWGLRPRQESDVQGFDQEAGSAAPKHRLLPFPGCWLHEYHQIPEERLKKITR